MFQSSYHPSFGDIRRHDISITNTPRAEDTVPATLVIDSRRRNTTKYPGAGRYTFDLEKEYRDVTQIELVSASLPNSGYNIGPTNNMIYLNARNGGVPAAIYTRSIEIPVGYYAYDTDADQPTTLLEALNNQNNVDDGNPLPFDFGYDQHTQRIIVNIDIGTTDVDFYYGLTNGADDVIGLSGITLLDGGQRIDTLQDDQGMPRNLQLNPFRYLTLKIRELERCEGNTAALEGCFAVIPLDTTKSSYTLIMEGDEVDSGTYTLYFSEPRRIRKMEISIYDPYGNIYDFNGHDHYLIFRFLSLTRPLKYRGCSK